MIQRKKNSKDHVLKLDHPQPLNILFIKLMKKIKIKTRTKGTFKNQDWDNTGS